MPEARASDPNPTDLTPEEEAQDPTTPEDVSPHPEDQQDA
jgi:hypothetical protein